MLSLSRTDDSIHLAEVGLEALGGDTESRDALALMSMVACGCMLTGDRRWAEELNRAIGPRLRSLPYTRDTARAYELSSNPHLIRGELEKAPRSSDELRRTAERHHDPMGIAHANEFLGTRILDPSGDTAGAIACLQSVVATYRRCGDVRRLCWSLVREGRCAVSLGELPRAKECVSDAMELSEPRRYGPRARQGKPSEPSTAGRSQYSGDVVVPPSRPWGGRI